MTRTLTPVREYEVARQQAAACELTTCRVCARDLHRATMRLALSAVAYTLVALAVIGAAWVFIVLTWGAVGTVPITNVQLPTR